MDKLFDIESVCSPACSLLLTCEICNVQVMQTLKDLAHEGCTVVCSIHQPRSSIFAMFDDLLVISEGKLLYEGSAEASLEFFEAQVPSFAPPCDPCGHYRHMQK